MSYPITVQIDRRPEVKYAFVDLGKGKSSILKR